MMIFVVLTHPQKLRFQKNCKLKKSHTQKNHKAKTNALKEIIHSMEGVLFFAIFLVTFPHLLLTYQIFHWPFEVNQMNPAIENLRAKTFLKHDCIFAVFDKGPLICVHLPKCHIPPPPIPTNPMKCFKRSCHLFSFRGTQTPGIF